MRNIKIRIIKEDADSSGFIGLDEVLGAFKKDALEIIEPQLSDLRSEIESKALDLSKLTTAFVRKKLLNKGIFDLHGPVNITATSDLEKMPLDEGLIYYDTTNKRYRVSTPDGWKTVKLNE